MKTKKVTIIVMLSSLLFSCSQNETQPDSSSIKSNGYDPLAELNKSFITQFPLEKDGD